MFGPTRIIATTFEDGPLWPVWSFHCPFPFDKIVVSSTALLHPMPTFSGLGQISSADCIISFREWNFQNFNPEFLLNRKRSLIMRRSCALAAPGGHWCLHACNSCSQGTRQSYAGHPRFYGFRTLGSLQFFLQQSLIWKLNHSMPLVIFVPLVFIFFWRIPRLHQQLMFIMSLSQMKLGKISYMYNVLTAVNDWLWQKNSSELQLICLV